MLPGYLHESRDAAPIDLLLISLSNWPDEPVYPYAFVQISALARRAGLSVQRWDGVGLDNETRQRCIDDLLRRYQPRAVGFTLRQNDSTLASDYLGTDATPDWFPVEDTRAAIQHIRTVSSAKILVGGFTFTVKPVETAEYLQPDLAIVGEPDDLLAHFDEVIGQGRTAGIANLLYWQDGQWQQNERVYYGPLNDLEYTPEIINELVRFYGEHTLRATHLAPVPGLGSADGTSLAIAVEISRGCPCHCAFCCEPFVKGRDLRLRDLDVVEREIKNLLGFGLRYFWFVCSELTFTKAHVLALAERIIAINATLPQPIYWRSYFLPVKFDKNEMRILLRSGLLLEQNGLFSDLTNDTLTQLHEPYRVKHALQHLQDLIELNEEPEFAHRKMEYWILWAWLANPYATKQTVQKTIADFVALGLDHHFDAAFSYPALRVYGCLENLPQDVPAHTERVTRGQDFTPSVIHPSFYHNQSLLKHFGSKDSLYQFLRYANETLMSRYYRVTRNWERWYYRQAPNTLNNLLASLTATPLPLPPWVDHPDCKDHHPNQNWATAYQAWQDSGRIERQFIERLDNQPAAQVNDLLAALLHQGFAQSQGLWQPLFDHLGLLESAWPVSSPYRVLALLLSRCADHNDLYQQLADYGATALAWLSYYLYALDVQLRPELKFLSAPLPAFTPLPLIRM